MRRISLGAWLVVCFFVAGLALADQETVRPQAASRIKTEKDKTANWGVEVTALRLSAGGRIVDFRYRVLDPGKAAVLGDQKVRPMLIDQATGTRLHVPSMPKVGQLRSTTQRMQVGKIYTALFSNGSGAVKNGSKVTVVFGNLKAEDLTVTE
jgi:hypothetical protein